MQPHDSLQLSLKTHFGFTSFRPNQRQIIEAVMAGRDVFAALPTGGGKSLCYQLPALLREGLTVVVSPLISLMKDQVDAARENGIPASFLNSTLGAEETRETWRAIVARRVKLLYLSPERLAFPDFRRILGELGLASLAVDEAHCISEWGHEFRPDYRSLGLLRSDFPGIPIAAFTATATHQVQSDVITLLKLDKPLVVRASFDRPEIFYRVQRKLDVDDQIAEFIARHQGQPGIVYRGTRKAAEATAAHLAKRGVSAVAYHAGLDDETRRARQEAFVRDDVTVVVATIAFGMGIDKSNVRWIVHGDLPRSLESYYQETGRAARDGDPADTVLLHGPADIATLRWHIDRTESPVERERAEIRLKEVLRFTDSGVCRRKQLLAHFDEAYSGNCGHCDVCAGEVSLEDATTEAQMVLSAAARTGERFGAHHLADVVVGNPTDKVMERGHNTLPTFAVGKDKSRAYWLSLIQDMEAAEFLVRGEGKTAGYRISDSGRMLLRGKERFLAPRRQERLQPADNTTDVDAGALPYSPADQERLLECLKQLRRRIAHRRNVPPYVVFSDKTLRVITENRPRDRAALLRCHGVGEKKLEAYGEEFLAAIGEFITAGG